MNCNQHAHPKTYNILKFLFIMGFGTLLHFTFKWSNQNRIVALFSAVNESTWEHLKLLVFPLLLVDVFEYIKFGHNCDNYMIAKALGLLSGIMSIIVLHYTYKGVIGKGILFLDITIFLASIIIAISVSNIILNRHLLESKIYQIIGGIIILVVIISFMLFTYYPPKINLFMDPPTKQYGYPD